MASENDIEAIRKNTEEQVRIELNRRWTAWKANIALVVSFIAIVVAVSALGFSLFRGLTATASQQAALVPSSPSLAATPGAAPQAPGTQPGAFAPTQPPRVATATDGTIYSFDPGTGQYFTMTAEGLVYPLDSAAIPADVLARLDEDRYLPPTVATPEQLEQQTAQARAAIAAESAVVDHGDLAINAVLARPDLAEEFTNILGSLNGIDAPGDLAPEGGPVFAFMDPRCPYCHRAYEDLAGVVSVRWLPTLALGDGGDDIASTLIGAATAQRDADGAITGVTLDADSGREARLDAQLGSGRMEITSSTLTEEQTFVLLENLTVLRQLYGAQGSLLGVPTFIVPKADGTAVMLRGYDPSVIEEIVTLTRARIEG